MIRPMSKNNKEYWKKRFEDLERFNHQRGRSFYHKIEKQYQIAMDAIEKDLSKWYLRFSKNNEISYVDARKLLNSKELKEFRWNVDQYMEKAKNNIDGRWTKQLENASAKVHITRLDALNMQMQQHCEQLFGNYHDQTSEYLNRLYTENFYHTAFEVAKGTGVGTNFARLDKKMVDLVIHKPWASDGKEFSGRIWENRSKLVNTLHSELTTAIIKGDAPQKTIKAVAKKMDVSRSQAENLVLTETAALSSKATQDSYQELGLNRYEILATLDSRTSEICRNMDRKKFDMKDYQVGVTAPPFHPRCRTTTIPDIDGDITGERAARGKDGKTYYVPADMTYQQWEKKYVGKEQKKNVPNIQIKDVNNAESFKKYSDKEIRDISKKMDKLAEKHINNKSKWSGNIVINPPDSVYGKLWNCDISTPSETCPHILLHEQIHAHSISYYTPKDYIDNYKIEESSVQLLTQEISDRENIEIIESQYDELVMYLREINQIAKISGNDYEFAVELIETPVPERLSWLEQKIFDIMMKGGTVDEYRRLTELIEDLRN
ncbi:MAG: minor capsid protein [Anaerostipes caccae]|uniref:minor capsid protein n=3 Tax=Anaerostipes caccae TaxID=105841 RepID=UPI001A999FF7|nr:minor capsid protein [Anaerostipes caccae]